MRILLLITITLTSLSAFSQSLSRVATRYRCNYEITDLRGPELHKKLTMSGVIEHNGGENEHSYLTLEPVISSSVDITARVLLTSFGGDKYFPMTLHPRGNTANYLAHSDLQGKLKNQITYRDDAYMYSLICHVN